MTTFFTKTDIGLTAEQASGSLLDYGLDWSDWLSSTPGDAIASSSWTADPALTLSNLASSTTATSVWVTGGAPGEWYELVNTVTTTGGRRDSRLCLLYIKPGLSGGVSLFRSRSVAIAKLRRDRLMMAAANSIGDVSGLSDDYLWDKLRAAESEMAHELRVPLVPTHFFPAEPTAGEIAELAGQPWALDPGYDYAPKDFAYNDKWGFIKLRNKPLHSVSRVRFAYPGGPTAHYDLPLDWLRVDKKYGQVQFVPSSTAFAAPLNAFVMQAIGQGRTIPLAIQITYVAGLENVPANYPELLDVILKKAALKVIEDAFLPQSGSISADGLSQSMSHDMDKHRETIDRIINGEKGSNGGLMTAIHGVRFGVMGG